MIPMSAAPNQANVAVAPRVNPKSWWRWKPREINHGLPPCARLSRVSGDEIKAMAQACLAPEVVARTDGWQAYRVLNSKSSFHIPIVTGSGKNAVRLFPWVHTLIANVKGNIRGVY